MVGVAKDLHDVQRRLPDGVCLVAISEYHLKEMIASTYAAGQRVFGEGRGQEFAEKVEVLPNDIRWHFTGHLQTNKVRYIAPYISMVESVDSPKLLRGINKHTARSNHVIDVLLELHVAEEATKYGFILDKCRDFLEVGEWRELSNVRICGLMMMASGVDDERQIRQGMLMAKDFFNEVKERCFADQPSFKQRSWGMGHDYLIAVTCGSTMVRVGGAISGER